MTTEYLARYAEPETYEDDSFGIFWTAKKRRYEKGGDALYTALNTLTLQTYYRYRVLD